MSSNNEADTHSYTVLYYKRKASKVHKSKGVSKMDGSLTILPPPKATVTLKDGNDNTVFRGSIADISKRASDFQQDEIVSVGNYEVEICDRIGVKQPLLAVAASAKPTAGNQKSLTPTTTTTGMVRRRPLHPSSRPLLPAKKSSSNLASRKNSLKRPLAGGRRLVQPAQPKPRTRPTDDDSDDSDSDNGNIQPTAAMKENTPNLPLKRGPLSRKLLGSTKFRKVRKLATTAATTTTSSSTTTTNLFIDAIGTPDVPHSIKSVLKPHQITGVSFLWNCLTGSGKASTASPHVLDNHGFKGAILADEMGLGKTLMTIAALCALHRQKRDRRFVVVCPSSLVTNWANEFDKWLGKASQPKRVVVKKGGQEGTSQIKAWSNKASEILIISYDLFRMNSNLFGHVQKPVACLVVDEGHRLKNTNGSLTLTALESLPCQARLCITATPIQNILSDFFTIANFVCPGVLGDLPTFRRNYEKPISAANNKNSSNKFKKAGLAASRCLESITKTFMLRRLQKDILKTMLPPRNEVFVFCRPSSLQSNLYEQITKGHRNQNLKATSDALTSLIQLRKLCSHPTLLQEDGNLDSDRSNSIVEESGKLQVLSALLEQIRETAPSDKIVIVSNFTSALSLIQQSILLPQNYPFIRLDGTTEVKKRQAVVDTFNTTTADRHFVFLLSSKAGGCGLNLIGANRLVMFDPDWNPASDIQAMARVYRQGQTKPCFIYRLFTTGTVEEVICQRQIQKGNLATRAVDGEVSQSSGNKTSFSKAELQDCFTLKRHIQCDTKNKLGTRWPNYTGASSIIDNGCDDGPLIAVAEEESNNPVSFVHVVKEVELIKGDAGSKSLDVSDSDDSESDDQNVDFTSEEEFE